MAFVSFTYIIVLCGQTLEAAVSDGLRIFFANLSVKNYFAHLETHVLAKNTCGC